ncbi:hypothetical protein ACIQV3_39400 [Streptomyces sp. NPDC099050]|uniref:hypothetical protein n=1 Tax=Streptomyces sp. NPDC099050 TaxID=3366100 RepID=UPI0037F17548
MTTTTTTMRLTPVTGDQPHGGETIHRHRLEPIFAELAQRWESAGHLVPGRHDEEWAVLIRRYTWPRR